MLRPLRNHYGKPLAVPGTGQIQKCLHGQLLLPPQSRDVAIIAQSVAKGKEIAGNIKQIGDNRQGSKPKHPTARGDESVKKATSPFKHFLGGQTSKQPADKQADPKLDTLKNVATTLLGVLCGFLLRIVVGGVQYFFAK